MSEIETLKMLNAYVLCLWFLAMLAHFGPHDRGAAGLRSGPGANHGHVTDPLPDERMFIIGARGHWYRVTLQRGGTVYNGYVHADYVQRCTNE